MRELAEAVRRACIAAALRAYEDARMRGLCHEGAFEAAVGALRGLDAGALADAAEARGAPSARDAAARTGALAAALLGRAAALAADGAPEDFRPRARAIATRAATLAASLGSDARASEDAALELAARCAQVATLAAEVAKQAAGASQSDAAVALRLAASAAECGLALGEERLDATPESDRTRSARRRIWRTRLLLRRARPAAAEEGGA